MMVDLRGGGGGMIEVGQPVGVIYTSIKFASLQCIGKLELKSGNQRYLVRESVEKDEKCPLTNLTIVAGPITWTGRAIMEFT
jgi:hypothetical protein